jgi:hypothetical protein
MVSVNITSLLVAVTLGLVDDLSGELLVYPSDLWLGSQLYYRAVALLCSGSLADDPYLIYGDDDHLVSVASELYY